MDRRRGVEALSTAARWLESSTGRARAPSSPVLRRRTTSRPRAGARRPAHTQLDGTAGGHRYSTIRRCNPNSASAAAREDEQWDRDLEHTETIVRVGDLVVEPPLRIRRLDQQTLVERPERRQLFVEGPFDGGRVLPAIVELDNGAMGGDHRGEAVLQRGELLVRRRGHELLGVAEEPAAAVVASESGDRRVEPFAVRRPSALLDERQSLIGLRLQGEDARRRQHEPRRRSRHAARARASPAVGRRSRATIRRARRRAASPRRARR